MLLGCGENSEVVAMSQALTLSICCGYYNYYSTKRSWYSIVLYYHWTQSLSPQKDSTRRDSRAQMGFGEPTLRCHISTLDHIGYNCVGTLDHIGKIVLGQIELGLVLKSAAVCSFSLEIFPILPTRVFLESSLLLCHYFSPESPLAQMGFIKSNLSHPNTTLHRVFHKDDALRMTLQAPKC
jgi:hypothetical protein